jgi:Mrp family chromosome partitioning ATPase
LPVDEQSGGTTLTMLLGWLHQESSFQRTTLVDFDTQKSTLSRCYGVVGKPGVIRLGAGESAASNVAPVGATVAAKPTATGALVSPEAGRASGSLIQQSLTVLEEVAAENDLVLVDFPAATRPGPTLGLASSMDAMVLVVEAERTTADSVARLIRQIERTGGVVAGVVLTKSRRSVPRWLENILG